MTQIKALLDSYGKVLGLLLMMVLGILFPQLSRLSFLIQYLLMAMLFFAFAYYEAQRRGATGFIGLLVDSPTDGCDFYVPYDGFLKGLPGVWVGREHAARMRVMAIAGTRVRLWSTGYNASWIRTTWWA